MATERWPMRCAALSISALSLGLALQGSDGIYAPPALALVLLSWLFLLGACLIDSGTITDGRLTRLLAGAIWIELAAGFFRVPGASTLVVAPAALAAYHICLVMVGTLVLIICLAQMRAARAAAFGVLVVFAGLGVWALRLTPHPHVDVFEFGVDAPRALARGVDPYTITFPNIYGPDTKVYGPGMLQNGRLLFGYPYMPLVLYWTAPAQLLLGDFRYAQLLAVLIAAGAIMLLNRGRIGMLAAALLLCTPRALYIIESGWTEPVSLMLLALLMLAAERKRFALTAALLGLFIASKQYLPGALLVAPLLFEKGQRVRWLVLSVAVAALVSAPLVLWNVGAFVHSAVTLQLHQPFRRDALSLLGWWAASRPDWTGPFWLAFVVAGLAAMLFLIRRRAFCTAAAFVLISFFVTNKQAFANYYFLVIGALCLAIVVEKLKSPMPTSDKLSDDAPAAAHSLTQPA